MSLAVCIDATLTGLALSLVDRDSMVWHSVNSHQTKTSHLMAQQIQLGLAEINKRVDDIEGVMVATGPGSFTGIKVSLAFAYGLVETGITRRLSFGFSSLENLGEAYAQRRGAPVALFLKSTQTAGYVVMAGQSEPTQCYVVQLDKKQSLIYQGARCQARSTAEVIKMLNNYKSLTLGTWPEARQVIEVDIEEVAVEAALHDSLGLMQKLFCKNWPQGFSPEIPEPIYLRPSSPEEKIFLSRLGD